MKQLAAIALVVLSAAWPAAAQEIVVPNLEVSVNPTEVVGSGFLPGTFLDFTIDCKNLPSVNCAVVTLDFNPTVLGYLTILPGDFFDGNNMLVVRSDAVDGHLVICVARGGYASEDRTFVVVKFMVVGVGNTTLSVGGEPGLGSSLGPCFADAEEHVYVAGLTSIAFFANDQDPLPPPPPPAPAGEINSAGTGGPGGCTAGPGGGGWIVLAALLLARAARR